ncbi:4150_t:CDS:2, partial [Racocetra persica]
LRPKFAKETPDIYVELAGQCMNADASKRPSANDLIQILCSESSKNVDIITSRRIYKLIHSNHPKPINSTDIPEFDLDKYKSRISQKR